MSDDYQWQGFPGEAEMVKAKRAAEAKAKHEAEEELSKKQQTALAELQRGATFKAAAEAAGVNRVTLYRWVKSDPSFRASYNAWEQEACESARARLVMAADTAVSKVLRCLDTDAKFAFAVLKELGIFRQRAAGKIDPELVRQEIELEMKLPEMPGNARVKRVAPATSRPSEPPQLTMLRALLDQRKGALDDSEGNDGDDDADVDDRH